MNWNFAGKEKIWRQDTKPQRLYINFLVYPVIYLIYPYIFCFYFLIPLIDSFIYWSFYLSIGTFVVFLIYLSIHSFHICVHKFLLHPFNLLVYSQVSSFIYPSYFLGSIAMIGMRTIKQYIFANTALHVNTSIIFLSPSVSIFPCLLFSYLLYISVYFIPTYPSIYIPIYSHCHLSAHQCLYACMYEGMCVLCMFECMYIHVAIFLYLFVRFFFVDICHCVMISIFVSIGLFFCS